VRTNQKSLSFRPFDVSLLEFLAGPRRQQNEVVREALLYYSKHHGLDVDAFKAFMAPVLKRHGKLGTLAGDFARFLEYIESDAEVPAVAPRFDLTVAVDSAADFGKE
jgi:hypothetical protein